MHQLPALIDPHVHLRTPGHEYKEDWVTGSRAAIAGGITTVLDMPNNNPPCVTNRALEEKRALIDSQLQLPLRYGLYLGADQDHLDEIAKAPGPIKIFMGSSTGTLLLDDQASLEKAFHLAAEHDKLVAIHAEDEASIGSPSGSPANHSLIRTREAALIAIKRALSLVEKYGTRLYILHLSSQIELDEIRRAKDKGLSVFAETTPHHMFLNTDAYKTLGTRAQVNPPLRCEADRRAIWSAIHDGTIDTVGTDHAPHTIAEKDLPYPQAPSGMPGLETLLPLLMTAVSDGKLSLSQLIELTRTNAQKIFRLPDNDDLVFVDMEERLVDPANLCTKCGWSPFAGWALKGWPVKTVIEGQSFYATDLRHREELPAESR